jgi:hypothetical protein
MCRKCHRSFRCKTLICSECYTSLAIVTSISVTLEVRNIPELLVKEHQWPERCQFFHDNKNSFSFLICFPKRKEKNHCFCNVHFNWILFYKQLLTFGLYHKGIHWIPLILQMWKRISTEKRKRKKAWLSAGLATHSASWWHVFHHASAFSLRNPTTHWGKHITNWYRS